MKKILLMILAATLIFALISCVSSETADVPDEVAGKVTEAAKEKDSAASDPKTEDDPDDFQAAIPQEYRLKRNVTVNLNEPLSPAPENASEADFFSILGRLSNPDVDISVLFTREELENFFGMELNEEACSEIKTGSGVSIMRFGFIAAEGEEAPELRVTVMPFAVEAEAENAYEDWGGEEINGGPGKKSRILDMFGVTMITVLTDNHTVFNISGYMLENQEELMLAYIDDLLGKYAELLAR